MEGVAFLVVVLVDICIGAGVRVHDEARMRVPELVAAGGRYLAEQHAAVTRDGYVLQLQRVLARRGAATRRPAVLLVHGIINSSEDWVRMGPGRSLAFLLVDAGYDVWLGNLRGNTYTSHIEMKRNETAFWQFSFDEHGIYDIPAMIELVLDKTGEEELHYVGFSMGTSSYLVMCNYRPDLASRIVSFTALAPIASIDERNRPLFGLGLRIGLGNILRILNQDPVAIDEFTQRLLASFLCNGPQDFDICYRSFFPFIGDDYEQVDWPKSAAIFARLQPASVKQITHFAQMCVTGNIAKYDWGSRGNMKKYGKISPPLYNVSANIAPTALFYGKHDYLSSPRVARRLQRSLKKTNPVVLLKPVRYRKFNHFDFMYAKNIHKLVNFEIVKTLNTFSRKYGYLPNSPC